MVRVDRMQGRDEKCIPKHGRKTYHPAYNNNNNNNGSLVNRLQWYGSISSSGSRKGPVTTWRQKANNTEEWASVGNKVMVVIGLYSQGDIYTTYKKDIPITHT
jgi:hypothetical protein